MPNFLLGAAVAVSLLAIDGNLSRRVNWRRDRRRKYKLVRRGRRLLAETALAQKFFVRRKRLLTKKQSSALPLALKITGTPLTQLVYQTARYC